jgi:hypothetical protein
LTKIRTPLLAATLLALLLPAVAVAQLFQLRGRSSQPDITVPYDSHWVFTRIRYNTTLGAFGQGGWEHDYPTADRNLTAIVDYISHVRARLDGSNILDLDDEQIFENPIIYMSEPGFWRTTDEEATNLRAYLLKGGLIIFDDFEGEGHWRNMVAQVQRALPELRFIQLDVTHPLFHSFFNIQHLDVPHPTVNVPPGFFALFENNDPSGRLLAIANWNNDLGDYWEWSAEGLYGSDPTNDAYRLGVNYIIYAMTH